MRRSHPRVPCARSEQGAVAVEAGLVTTFMMPLLLGILFAGNFFWHAQKADLYDARIPTGAYAGQTFTCDGLVARVRSDVVALVNSTHGTAPDIGLDDVTALVVDVVPTVSAVVQVSVTAPPVPGLGSWLPDGGAVVNETVLRLDDVALTTDTCR
jgi:TadE-like protein